MIDKENIVVIGGMAIAFLFECVLAGGLAWFAGGYIWWLSLIVFPVVMLFGPYQYRGPMYATNGRIILDFITILVIIAYIGIAAYQFYIHFDGWWRIPVGLVVGFAGGTFIAPRRWHSEVQRGL